MSLYLTSLINETQTIDSVDIGPFDTQTRVGSSVTEEIAYAITKKRLQCDVLPVESNGASAFTDLTDAPPSYPEGADGRVVTVNAGGDALIFSGLATVHPTEGISLVSEAGGVNIEGDDNGGISLLTEGPFAITSAGATRFDITGSGAGGMRIQATAVEGAGIAIEATAASSGGIVLSGADGTQITMDSDGLGLHVGTGTLEIEGSVGVATQVVVIPGVGTMTFTHGILTSYVAA